MDVNKSNKKVCQEIVQRKKPFSQLKNLTTNLI
jgi:hypothetical protein